MRKYIITSELRELEKQVNLTEISYSRMIEILCEKADEYAKMYYEQEISKLHQPTVIGTVCKHDWYGIDQIYSKCRNCGRIERDD